MNTTRMSPSALRTTLIMASVIVLAAVLLLTGLWLGRMGWGTAGVWPVGMMNTNSDVPIRTSYGTGMLQNGGMGRGTMMNQGMMNGKGMMGGGMMNGNGMMGSSMMNGNNMMGNEMMQGNGMMGQSMLGNSSLSTNPSALSLENAQEALEAFLLSYGNNDLQVGEIMIFDNHAYAKIVEKSTGVGAMEVLVDPVTLAVTPEHGPNMMWNLKYSGMTGIGGGMMMGGGPGMMGNYGNPSASSAEVSAEMIVTPEEAVESAQRYLDTYLPGTHADEHADAFYGYYALHILRDGKVVGMLSVNGYTRQVFPHTWHGELIEVSGE